MGRLLQKAWRSAQGSTLLEAVVALGILSVLMGVVATSTAQMYRVEWMDEVLAVQQLRNAAAWFSRDAFNAQDTSLEDGGPAQSSVTLTWTDADGTPHTVTYSIQGDDLVRDADGTVHPVARDAVSVSFSLVDRTITMELTVQSPEGVERDQRVDIYLRMLS